MENLKTDYKDDIIATTARKYTEVSNSDGTISFTDKTVYTQEGDSFGADDINSITKNVNQINHITEVTLTADGWTGDTAPYEQVVDVSGIRADDNPILVSLLPDNASPTVQNAYMKAFGRISSGSGTVVAGSITFRAYKKPVTDITIGLKGV